MRKKILITGASGLVGAYLYEVLSRDYDCYGVDILKSKTCDSVLDLSDEAQSRDLMQTVRPQVVIHAAAIKDLLVCENDKKRSWMVNVDSVRWITEYVQDTDASLIYLSSDMVFNGLKGNYRENDLLCPINWYGATKAFSEMLIMSKLQGKVSILRTAQVFGPLKHFDTEGVEGAVETGVLSNQSLLPLFIRERLLRGFTVTLPHNIISSPTPIPIIGDVVRMLLIKNIHVGIMHVTGNRPYSRFELGKEIAVAASLPSRLVLCGDDSTTNLRPHNISMNTDYLSSLIDTNTADYDVLTYIKQQLSYA